TKRGAQCIIRNGYTYYFHKLLSSGDKRYRCSNYQTIKCKGSVQVTYEDTFREATAHNDNCFPNTSASVVSTHKSNLKRKATDSSFAHSKIVASSITELGESASKLAESGNSKLADAKI